MFRLKTFLGIATMLIATTASGAMPVQQDAKQPIYTITINDDDRTTKAIK
jgi:hypothetical protein